MILNPKQTTVAYRCPHCGGGVMSAVNLFSLPADLVKLKCDCGKSEMSLTASRDGTVRLTVPCLLCADPHTFTLQTSLFFDKDLITLPCPYTADLPVVFIGEINHVKSELARTELALLDLMEQNGLKDFDAFHDDEGALPDPEIERIVLFVINDMDAEGKIHCKCDPADGEREYEIEITNEGVRVSCKKCGAVRLIPTDSRIGAYSFLNADELYLE